MPPANPPAHTTRLAVFLWRVAGLLHQLNVLLILPAIFLLVLTDIVLRSATDAPLIWTSEVLGLLLLCLFFLELPHALQQQDLLFVELFFHKLPSALQRVIPQLVWLLLGVTGVLLGWLGIAGALEMADFEEGALTLDLPFWPFSLLIGVSGILMTMQALEALWSRRRLVSYAAPQRE